MRAAIVPPKVGRRCIIHGILRHLHEDLQLNGLSQRVLFMR
jgi:hypothetical protein